MTQPYQLITNSDAVLRREDNATIPNDDGNRDWQQYQQFLADGGVPDPAPPPSPIGVIAKSAQSLRIADSKSLAAQGRTDEAIAALLRSLPT